MQLCYNKLFTKRVIIMLKTAEHTIVYKPNQRLEDLPYSDNETFYKIIREAVAYLDEYYGLSDDDEKTIRDAAAIMKGSKNPLDENGIAISRAESYGIITIDDLVKQFTVKK